MKLDKVSFIENLPIENWQRDILNGIIKDELNEFLDWAYAGMLETMTVKDPAVDPKWHVDLKVCTTNEELINYYNITK